MVTLFVALAGMSAVSVSARFSQLTTECSPPNCAPSQLATADLLAFRPIGIPVDLFAGYVTAFDTLIATGFLVVAAAILWRRPNDRVALLTAFLLATVGVTNADTTQANSALVGATSVATTAAYIAVVGCLAVFPDGRFVPRWMIPVVAVWSAWRLSLILLPGDLQWLAIAPPYRVFVTLGGVAVGVVAQVIRYRNVSNRSQRQQTKWVVFGCAVAVLGWTSHVLPFTTLTSVQAGAGTARVLYVLADVPFHALAMLVVPATLAISIGRHRLWEIDLIINRTFVYVSLTAILGGLFSALTTLSQRLFVALTGEKSDAAVVVTTLVVVTLFTPIKGGLQAIADRRIKEPARPGVELRQHSSKVRDVVEVIDPELAIRKLLAKAVLAFGSTGGAAYLTEEGELRLVDTIGDWAGGPALSVPLEAEGARVGLIALGPRRTGQAYPTEDVAALEDAASITAHAATLLRRLQLDHGPNDQRRRWEGDQLAG